MSREQPNIRETWRLYLPFGFECSWSNYQLMAVLLERWYWVMIISWDSQILCSECPALIDAFIWFSASLLAKHGEKQLLPFYLDWASQLTQPVLLDWLLSFPESFPVEEKKALINCSSCGSLNKCGFWWTLHKWKPTVKQNLSLSFKIWLTKVGEIHLDSFLEVLDLKLKKAISIFTASSAHTKWIKNWLIH